MHRSTRCALTLFSLGSLCAVAAAPVEGQWRADLQAGRLQYETAPEAASTSVALGLSHVTTTSDFGVSAGLPFSSEEPVWGALHGYRRFATADALRFGIDLAASGFAYRIDAGESLGGLPIEQPGDPVTGWGASLEAMPLVAWSGAALTAEARAGAVQFVTSASGAEPADRTAFVVDGSLASSSARPLAVRLDARWVAVTEGEFPYAGIGVTWAPGVTLWGSVGKWLDSDIPTLSWSAGASVPMGSRLSLVVHGRHDALDPIYATPARTTWGAGLSLLLGDPPAAVAEPVPAAYEDGVATIAIAVHSVDGRPSIAGDFNDWTPTPMTRRGDAWTHEVALAPGVYSYAFVDAAGEWLVPEGTQGRRDDGMGGHVAVLVVEE